MARATEVIARSIPGGEAVGNVCVTACSPHDAASLHVAYSNGRSPVAPAMPSTLLIVVAAVAEAPEWTLNAAPWLSVFAS
jgi:hypothetical protein